MELGEALERRAIARVLRSNPQWRLSAVFGLIDTGGSLAVVLGSMTVQELLLEPGFALPEDDGPLIDVETLARARRVDGRAYDRLVLEVLVEARRPVRASYLVARVGGPRWKLQAAMRRLVGASAVTRSGVTSDTRYMCESSVHGDTEHRVDSNRSKSR